MKNVKIKFCLGASGTPKIPKGYHEVAELHLAEIIINPETTWLEAIQSNFGISLNPEPYFIQRHSSIRIKHPRRRSLKEQIGEWLTKDFPAKYHQALYRAGLCMTSKLRKNPKITAVKRKRGRPLGSTKSKKTKNVKQKRPSLPDEATSPIQRAKGLGALYIFKSAGVVLENEDLNPQLAPLHGQSFRIKDPLMTWEDIFSQHFGVDLDPERYVVRHSFSKMKEHDLREPVQHFLQEFPTVYQNKGNIILIAYKPAKENPTPATIRHPTAPAKKNLKRKQPPTPVLVSSGAESSDDDFEETDEDDDENMQPKISKVFLGDQKPNTSQYLRNCQEQEKDTSRKSKVNKRENQPENIRQEVYNLAAKFTNSQLIKAKAEILKLKEMSQSSGTRDPWSDWNTACPLPAAILRDLFDV